MPAQPGLRPDNRERLPPCKPPREQDEREAARIRRPPGIHLSLAVKGQLLPEEQVLDGQGCLRPEDQRHERHEIDYDRSRHPAQIHDWPDLLHEIGLPHTSLAV